MLLKHEDLQFDMDAPISPLRLRLTNSSRRPSLASSSTFSASSPMGIVGPDTPQSYGPQIPFDISMPELSFYSTSSLDYDDHDFNDYDSRKGSYSWTDTAISENAPLDINLHAGTNDHQLFHDQDTRHGQYRYQATAEQNNIFDSSIHENLDMHPIDDSTMISSQIYNYGLYSSVLPSTVLSSTHALDVFSKTHEPQQYPSQCFVTSKSTPVKRLVPMKQEFERASPISKTSRRKKDTRIHQTQDGHPINVDVVPQMSGIFCEEMITVEEYNKKHPNKMNPKQGLHGDLVVCGAAFRYKEHLQRHVNAHRRIGGVLCKVCNRPFTRNDNLRQHFRNVHFTLSGRPRKDRLVKELEDGSIVFLDKEITRLGVEDAKADYLRRLEVDAETAVEKSIAAPKAKVENRRSRKVTQRRLTASSSPTLSAYF